MTGNPPDDLSGSTEAVFAHAWQAGLLDPLPWGVLADKLDEDGVGEPARRCRAVMRFDPGAVDWVWSQDGAEAQDDGERRLTAAFSAAGAPVCRLAVVLFQEFVAGRRGRDAWSGPVVVAARRAAVRLALGLPAPDAAASRTPVPELSKYGYSVAPAVAACLAAASAAQAADRADVLTANAVTAAVEAAAYGNVRTGLFSLKSPSRPWPGRVGRPGPPPCPCSNRLPDFWEPSD